MNWKADTVYVTRGGFKCRIYAVDGPKGAEIHAAVRTDQGWQAGKWDSNGRYRGTKFDRGMQSSWDLTKREWEDQEKLYAYRDKDGNVRMHDLDNLHTDNEGWIRLPHLDGPDPSYQVAPWGERNG